MPVTFGTTANFRTESVTFDVADIPLPYNGILGRDTPEAVTLVTAERTEIRIPRSDMEEIHPSRVSIMPQGLDTQLSRQELSDLIAFLTSLK